MDFNKTVDLIIRDLEEAREIIDDLKNYQGVPVIQIEMAKSKCRNAAEVIALLKNKTEDISRKPLAVSPEPVAVSREPVAVSREPLTGSREPVVGGIIADTFDNMHDSLNEKLGSMRSDKDITDYLKSQPVANLSRAIGVNDRFLFIRELFNGNSESYSQAIIKIDEAKNLSDAKTLIQNFAGDKVETEAGKHLLDFVKRKFPADE